MKVRVKDTWPDPALRGATGDATGFEDDSVLVTLEIEGRRTPWRFLPSEVDLIPESTFDESRFEPFVSGGLAGFKVRLDDGTSSYVYLHPSAVDEGETPNVFVYEGPHRHPGKDTPVIYVDIGVPTDYEVSD
jgi:hypothetical protein